jgi:Zn-dependent M28 family amino/carboxypeptidase
MEAARLIMAAGGKPKRTILVCLFAAEEFGLYGSKAWVESNRDKLPKIANVFNRDYGPLAPTSMSVPEGMLADMKEICAPVSSINPEYPFEVKLMSPRARPKVARGSDAGTFMVEGVPALGLGISDVKGYNFDYSEIWHTERDTYNMSIEEYQKHTAIVTAVVVYGVANLNHLLSRKGLFIEDKLVQ